MRKISLYIKYVYDVYANFLRRLRNTGNTCTSRRECVDYSTINRYNIIYI